MNPEIEILCQNYSHFNCFVGYSRTIWEFPDFRKVVYKLFRECFGIIFGHKRHTLAYIFIDISLIHYNHGWGYISMLRVLSVRINYDLNSKIQEGDKCLILYGRFFFNSANPYRALSFVVPRSPTQSVCALDI